LPLKDFLFEQFQESQMRVPRKPILHPVEPVQCQREFFD
jgi:hypothetical protein